MTIFRDVCHAKVHVPRESRKRKKDYKSSTYNAPEGFTILGYKPIKTSKIGAVSYEIDMVAANSKFVSNNEISEAYKEAVDFAAKLGIKGEDLFNLTGKLNNSYSSYLKQYNEIVASHQTLTLNLEAKGQGVFKGTSELEMHLHVELKAVPVELGSKNEMKKTFKGIVKQHAPNKATANNATVSKAQVSKLVAKFMKKKAQKRAAKAL